VKPVIFHSAAEAELRFSASYYERQKPGLGREFRQEIEASVALIRENPHQFPFHNEDGTRRCLVHRFPYTLFFVELTESIWVAAVAHQKRQPEYWGGRRPE
jgi:toxin ParE1/3/4